MDKYLGFPMIHGKMKKSYFDFIVDKMQSCFDSWKTKLLNKVRRISQQNLYSTPSQLITNKLRGSPNLFALIEDEPISNGSLFNLCKHGNGDLQSPPIQAIVGC